MATTTMPPTQPAASEPSLTESFVAVACCEDETARRYLQCAAGDMKKALARYYADQERRWDAARSAAGTAAAPVFQCEAKGAREHETTENAEAEDIAECPSKLQRTRTSGSFPARPLHCGEQAPQGDDASPQLGKKRARPGVDADECGHIEGEVKADYDHLDPSLPWNKLKLGGGQEFVFDSVKSKVQATNFQGPQEGSTWHWFMVGDQKVYPDDESRSANAGADGANASTHPPKAVLKATTYINGDKFQAGWARDPAEKMSEKVMTTRKASMLQSILEDKVNAYGKHRGGCKPGYSHRWTYADSAWAAPDTPAQANSISTSECFWDEQKNVDRWLVNIHMKWAAQDKSDAIVPGVYVIVADQMATKLNKNQYQTAMKGRRWRVGSLDDAPEVIAAAKRAVLTNCLATLRATAGSLPPPPKKAKLAQKQQTAPHSTPAPTKLAMPHKKPQKVNAVRLS